MLMLAAAIDGGPEAVSKFEALYHEYRAQMMHIACGILGDHHLAEDAVQEAFLKIASNLQKIGGVHSRETKGFLLTITKNTALSMRKAVPTAGLDDGGMLSNTPDPQGMEDLVFERAGFEALVGEIMDLDEIYRGALYLQWVEELKVKEIAKLLGVPAATVKQRLYRGKRLLRERLAQKGYGGGQNRE